MLINESAIKERDKLSNRFSVGFTDEQFQIIEEKRMAEVIAGREWISRADIVRRMLFDAAG